MQRASSEVFTTLQGKIVCITGSCETVSRDELKAALTAAGATVAGSVNKHTSLLVKGDHNWGTKLSKAQELGIQVIECREIAAKLRAAGFLDGENQFPPYNVGTKHNSAYTEQMIANVIAMVMVELQMDTLIIDDLSRAKVMTGKYTIRVNKDPIHQGTRFTLVNEESRDAM